MGPGHLCVSGVGGCEFVFGRRHQALGCESLCNAQYIKPVARLIPSRLCGCVGWSCGDKGCKEDGFQELSRNRFLHHRDPELKPTPSLEFSNSQPCMRLRG